MAVLIKVMKMPKVGNWKTIRVYYDGTCAEPNWQGDCKVMKGCEAVPIPDHGDLIDRDVVADAIDLMAVHGRLRDAFDMVMSCEAVIPAERSEDDRE